jgi:TolB-like protein/class 3 adenylate cyclase
MSPSGGEPEVHPQVGGDDSDLTEQADSGTLEIAHILFMDIVGYSLLPMDGQKDYLAEFQRIVRHSPRFLAAEGCGEIISLPTGDGMALVFLRDPLAPLQCALEVATGLKGRPHLKVRMGINSGPVFRVSDLNSHANVAGNGINIAQRVMDCGDAGHILVSKGVAETLLQFSQWAPHLTDFGEAAVKQGVMLRIFNLTKGEAGVTEMPARLKAAVAKPRKPAKIRIAVGMAILLALAAAGWWSGRGRWSAAAPDDASIAVLPFADISQEKNQAYFAEGLAEELLDGLGGVPGLRVAARASSFRFKDGGGDFRTIRDKLQVASILQGSVRKFGNRARISVQLIKTSDGFELWHDSFDREMSDILAVQQDIASAVVAKLKVTSLVKHTAAAVSRNVNGAAYDAYLQGLYLDRHGSRENLRKAEALYEQSLQLDPTSARAWASLGSNRADQALHNYIPRDEGFSKAREALDRARALDANLAQPDSTLAFMSMYHDWNWEAATFYSQKALSLDPGSPTALNTAATLAMVLGQREKAIVLYRQAVRIDPLSSAKLLNEGLVYYYSGRYAEAENTLRQSLSLAPDRDDVHMTLALVRLAQGEAPEALDEAKREKNEAHRLFALSLAHQALGNKTDADAELAKLISAFASDSPCLVGEIYAYRGDKNRAFEWFGKAYDAHDSELHGNQGQSDRAERGA